MQLGTTPNRPKPGTHDAAAPAQIVTTLDDAPPVCMTWTAPRTPPQPPGQAQQMQAGRQQARRWSRRQAPRRPQEMDTDGRQDDCRDGRPARQRGRTEPHRGRTAPARQDCREYINTLITLTTRHWQRVQDTAQKQTGGKRLYAVTFESMSTFARLTHHRQKMKHSTAPVNVKYFKKYRLMS